MALLRAADTMEDVHITDDPTPPTELQSPAVLVDCVAFRRRPRWLVGQVPTAGPHEESVTFSIHCYAFSGQGAGDARRQRDQLVQNVLAVFDADHTLGGMVDDHVVTAGEMDTTGEGAGVHARARLVLDASIRT